jgi:hypothetical protein
MLIIKLAKGFALVYSYSFFINIEQEQMFIFHKYQIKERKNNLEASYDIFIL